MSVTSNNRKFDRDIRKNLAFIVRETGGHVREKQASGGRIISTYAWETSLGDKSFNLIWHSSVSDRNHPKKVIGEIKRKLGEVPGLAFQSTHKGLPKKIEVDERIATGEGRFSRNIPAEVRLLWAFETRISQLEQAQNEKRIVQKVVYYIDAWIGWHVAKRMYKKGFWGPPSRIGSETK
jgi:hypothetical protein